MDQGLPSATGHQGVKGIAACARRVRDAAALTIEVLTTSCVERRCRSRPLVRLRAALSLIQIIEPTAIQVMMALYSGLGARPMTSYRVCFINEIPRNDKLFRCCQRLIIIRSARSPERAVEAAKKRFARMEGIRDWKIHAALIEMEAIDLEAKPKTQSYGNAEIPRTQKTSSR